jgi:hypothetical protein
MQNDAENPNPGATGVPSSWTHFADEDLYWASLWDGSTHDLPKIYAEVQKIKDFGFDLLILEALRDLYTEERYPDSVSLNTDGSQPSVETTQIYLAFARSVAQAISAELGVATS